MNKDELYINRTLELAKLGLGMVSPNPLVGCVVVHDGKVIGEGWHKKYGEAHAEVNAINSIKDKTLLPESTVYVNLEPCAHFGKTPPCADLLVKSGVKRVVIANIDSNPLVGGRGIIKLEDAGISVITGILEKEGRELNKRFFTVLEKKRPYIILKWAETADGFLARKDYDSKWISNTSSRKLVHKWRAEEDAILVGSNTALHDNPQLNVRDWTGRNPVRVLIDRNLTLPAGINLLDGSQPTLCYNLRFEKEEKNLSYIKLDENDFLESMLSDILRRNLSSIIIEGGAGVLESFMKKSLWDEARVFVSPVRFDEGIPSPRIVDMVGEEQIESDRLLIYKN